MKRLHMFQATVGIIHRRGFGASTGPFPGPLGQTFCKRTPPDRATEKPTRRTELGS